MFSVVDPIRQFMSNGEVCTLKSAFLAASVANNQSVVAAVAGKRIRVMGLNWQTASGAGAGTMQFKSNSGGSALTPAFQVPLQPTIDRWPISTTGYFETATGHGLFVDVATQAVTVMVFYIEYTPI